MDNDKRLTESLRQLLQPYASNWTGTLGRGDLVIPHRDIPGLIQELLETVRSQSEQHVEATETELFQAFSEARKRPSIQDGIAALQREFLIFKR